MSHLIRRTIRRHAKQTLVYWEKTGSDGFGKPIFADPVEVKCRWEDKQQEIILPDKRTVMTKGFIISLTPMLVGSLVFLGFLTDIEALPTYPTIPTVGQGVREILLVNNMSDVDNESTVCELYI